MFLHDDCNKKSSLYRFISISELYKYVFCFILINKLKSDLEGSGLNPMSYAYCVAQQFGGKRTHAFLKAPRFESYGKGQVSIYTKIIAFIS